MSTAQQQTGSKREILIDESEKKELNTASVSWHRTGRTDRDGSRAERMEFGAYTDCLHTHVKLRAQKRERLFEMSLFELSQSVSLGN